MPIEQPGIGSSSQLSCPMALTQLGDRGARGELETQAFIEFYRGILFRFLGSISVLVTRDSAP